MYEVSLTDMELLIERFIVEYDVLFLYNIFTRKQLAFIMSTHLPWNKIKRIILEIYKNNEKIPLYLNQNKLSELLQIYEKNHKQLNELVYLYSNNLQDDQYIKNNIQKLWMYIIQ